MIRKTKILCTLGPATGNAKGIAGLIAGGANIFRLNMSHASHDWVKEVVKTIRSEAAKVETEVAILMDLRGPSIRTGDLEEPLLLEVGDELELTLGEAKPKSDRSTSCRYSGLAEDVSVGDQLLIDGGVLQAQIKSVDPERIVAEMTVAGELGSRRHINLPGVDINLPALTKKDFEDIDLAVEVGEIDFVALSFARAGEHLRQLKAMLEERGSEARVVAKIENHQGIKHLDEIIKASGSIMVARGDLGVECAIEELPIIQRRIIERCSYFGRKVIVATEMLESMTENPVPTRAEITDVYNAVNERVDAVMLSGETAIGKYPLRCVDVLDRICRRIEEEFPGGRLHPEAPLPTTKHKTAKAAVQLAESIEGAKLLVFTKRGVLGHLIAHTRPAHAPIFAFCPSLPTVRVLTMSRSVEPFHMAFDEEPEKMIAAGIDLLKKRGLLNDGDAIVIVSDVFDGDDYVVDSILWRQV